MTTLIARPHPLRSELYTVDLGENAVLSHVIPKREGLHAQINGEAWPMDRWDEVMPAGEVLVTATPGDDGILRSVLQVAVAVAAVAAMAYGGPFAAAAVQIGGSLAVNELIPPKLPDQPNGAGQSSVVRNSITGTQNRSNPYGVIPRVYGNPIWYPSLAGNPVTESAGDDQYLRMLLCLGYGPLEIAGTRVGPGYPRLANADVGDAIRIGETNLGEYDSVDWEIGTADQMTLYTQDIEEVDPAVALDLQDTTTGKNLLDSQDDVSAVRTTAVDTTEISVDIVWPQGLYTLSSTGDLTEARVEILIEQRLAGTNNWTKKRSVVVSAKSKETVRKNWRWGVPKGQYDVRVTRVRTDGPNREVVVTNARWSALRSIQGDNPVYGNDRHVLLALRIKATDQLNGVVDQLSIRTQAVLRVWDGESFSLKATNNPAWAYLNALTGEQVPRPVTDQQISLPDILSWAEFCDEAGLGYSWVHDGKETLFQRVKAIASTGQASFSLQDGLYGVVRDSPSEPVVQMITPRNSWGLNFSRSYKKLPHGIRTKFVDYSTGAAGGTDSEVIVYRNGYDQSNATIFEDFETQGVTTPVEASFQGNYYLRQAVLRPESWTVEMDWENLAAVRGNRCSLSSDVLKVGLASARVAEFDAVNNVVRLDTPVEYTLERQYGMRVRQLPRDGMAYGDQQVVAVTADEVGYVDTFTLTGDHNDLEPGELVAYGVLDRETIDTKITRIEPGSDFSATLTLVPAAVDIYDFTADPIYDPGITNPIDPSQVVPPVPMITAARGDATAASRNPDGSYRTLIRVSYAFPVRIGVPSLQVEARYRLSDQDEWDHAGPFPATGTLSLGNIESHAEYVIQVRSRNRDRVSKWSQPVSTDVTGQAVIAPSGIDFEVGTFSVTLRPQSIYAGSQYEFFRAQQELSPGAVEANAVRLGTGTVMVDADLEPATEYWYYVRMYTVYAVSGFYIAKVTTREDFDAIIGAIEDDFNAPGRPLDQLRNGINDNAEAIGDARQDFETGLTEANTAITAAQNRIDEIEPIVEGAQTVVEDVNALTGRVDDAEYEITETQRISRLDSLLEAFEGSVNQVQTAAGAAAYSVERIQRISEDEALVQITEELDATLSGNIAGVRDQVTALVDTSQSLADSLSTLETEFGDATADYEQRITALSNTTQGLVEQTSSLSTALDDAEAEIDEVRRVQRLDNQLSAFESKAMQVQTAAGSATADTYRLVNISERQALAQQITALGTEFGDATSSINSTLTSLSSEQSAIAQRQESFEVDVNDQFASVQQNVSAVYDPDTGAVAQAITTVEVNGQRGMIGLQAFGEDIQFVGIADQFAILNEISGELVTAFVVADGRVVIPDALIRDASITTAKIADVLQSTNYASGSAGWIIRKNGSIEINSGIFRGELQVGTGSLGGNVTADGTSLSTIRSRANNGNNANTRVNAWTRSGTTLIDGGSIYADDAFIVNAMFQNASVDTLAIAGQAVTIHSTTSASSSITFYAGNGEVTLLSHSADDKGADVIILASFGSSGGGLSRVRIYRDNSLVAERSCGGSSGAFCLAIGIGASGSGVRSYRMTAISSEPVTSNAVTVSGRSISTLIARR